MLFNIIISICSTGNFIILNVSLGDAGGGGPGGANAGPFGLSARIARRRSRSAGEANSRKAPDAKSKTCTILWRWIMSTKKKKKKKKKILRFSQTKTPNEQAYFPILANIIHFLIQS